MNINDLKNYCLNKKGVYIDFPFDDRTITFKIGSKMFALSDIKTGEEKNLKVNLKCNPELAMDLRNIYEGVIPGWHMNKKHWNSVFLNSDIPINEIFKMIDHSYELVFKSLKKSEKAKIEV
ncbi:MmcQ/YjbR family DNA-binding protein [Haliovirga abyssi]|uniref:MmcQ/YjbR family DNA-binding protein n=1 Tax=Haliovirga abyssi TaxID=2996794 RepID=A0AAU9DN08_9FUSO|nr:MmcQ/YjbR family DNA-binding protein [Haliovirga abyssi]BDU49708.1 hypothetical protein HLVA_02770 [Haliovirga abyssi]